LENEVQVLPQYAITQLSRNLCGVSHDPLEGNKSKYCRVKGNRRLAILGTQRLEGKIVFFLIDHGCNPNKAIRCVFWCVDQRYQVACGKPRKYGDVGVIVRSFKLIELMHYHITGAMSYGEYIAVEIVFPAAALSTQSL